MFDPSAHGIFWKLPSKLSCKSVFGFFFLMLLHWTKCWKLHWKHQQRTHKAPLITTPLAASIHWFKQRIFSTPRSPFDKCSMLVQFEMKPSICLLLHRRAVHRFDVSSACKSWNWFKPIKNKLCECEHLCGKSNLYTGTLRRVKDTNVQDWSKSWF